jgi:hypothetical protein
MHAHIGRCDKQGVFADKYYASEPSIREEDPKQDAIEPVDLNGGFVGEKGDPDIVAKTEENVQSRFQLDPREE